MTDSPEIQDFKVRTALQGFAADVVQNTTVEKIHPADLNPDAKGVSHWEINLPILDVNNDFMQFSATVAENGNIVLTDSGHTAELIMLSGGAMKRDEAEFFLASSSCFFDEETGAIEALVEADKYADAGAIISDLAVSCLQVWARYHKMPATDDDDADGNNDDAGDALEDITGGIDD